MPKKKRKRSQVEKLLVLGLTTGAGATAISALPASAEVTPIKTSVTGGLAKFSTAFPPAFRLTGTGLVLKHTGSLIKTTRKLSKKRKKK